MLTISEIRELLTSKLGTGHPGPWPAMIWDLPDGGQVWYVDYRKVIRYHPNGEKTDWLDGFGIEGLKSLLA